MTNEQLIGHNMAATANRALSAAHLPKPWAPLDTWAAPGQGVACVQTDRHDGGANCRLVFHLTPSKDPEAPVSYASSYEAPCGSARIALRAATGVGSEEAVAALIEEDLRALWDKIA